MFAALLSDFRHYSRRLHVRILLITALSPLAVVLAKLFGGFLPDWLVARIGAQAVDPILTIIAGAMLAVTTFALTMMTGAFRTASSQWTPRAHLVMMEDTVTQNVLATFLGSYLFALTAIILRASDFFGREEQVILFFVTVLVVLMIVAAMVRWILHLETLGSLIETCARLEDKVRETLTAHVADPGNGCHILTDPGNTIPQGAQMIAAPGTGYLVEICAAPLQALANRHDSRIFVTAPVGRFVFRGDPLGFVDAPDTHHAEMAHKAAHQLVIRPLRGFSDDPRFGLVTLAEVATRALSPGVNDPGTAIDCIRRLGRILTLLKQPADAAPICHDRVWVPPLARDDMFEDAFDAIARCAGTAVEVHVVLQKTLAGIARQGDAALAEAATRCADRALTRAVAALSDKSDLARVRAAI